jgi:hypothetical protein
LFEICIVAKREQPDDGANRTFKFALPPTPIAVGNPIPLDEKSEAFAPVKTMFDKMSGALPLFVMVNAFVTAAPTATSPNDTTLI